MHVCTAGIVSKEVGAKPRMKPTDYGIAGPIIAANFLKIYKQVKEPFFRENRDLNGKIREVV